MRLSVPAIDFDAFHRAELPRRLASGNGPIAYADLKNAPPLGFRIAGAGSGYTYVAGDGTVRVAAGTSDADTVVELDLNSWREMVCEYRTPIGLAYAGKLSFPRGEYAGLSRWEAALWAVFMGRPVYDAAKVDLADAGGRPLDLHRRFAADEPIENLREFFLKTGYLVVKGLFSPAEIEILRGEVMRVAAEATPGDRHSWWAKNAAGEDLLSRLLYLGQKSSAIAALEDDPRLARLATMAEEPVISVHNRMDSPIAMLKVAGAVSGLADYPWHVDCGLGLHPVICPSVLMGIQLDAMTPESGQLHMLAGSWRYSCRQGGDMSYDNLPVVGLETEPGDCTVHFGHSLHAAPPPILPRGRRTIYVAYCKPGFDKIFAEGESPNDVLYTSEDAFIPTADVAGKTAGKQG
ncbi:MAG TPA: phytanoyl-CoA dioxygenase family protein [Candidatus Binataceae bacterium]|nr:phytanoyl-CoA dioxygenase family protein [Candidatus Binataceae bacterium]